MPSITESGNADKASAELADVRKAAAKLYEAEEAANKKAAVGTVVPVGEKPAADVQRDKKKRRKGIKMSAKKPKLQDGHDSDIESGNSSEDDRADSLAAHHGTDLSQAEWSDQGSSKAGGSWTLVSQLRPIIPSDRSTSDSSIEVSPGKHKIPVCQDNSEIVEDIPTNQGGGVAAPAPAVGLGDEDK